MKKELHGKSVTYEAETSGDLKGYYQDLVGGYIEQLNIHNDNLKMIRQGAAKHGLSEMKALRGFTAHQIKHGDVASVELDVAHGLIGSILGTYLRNMMGDVTDDMKMEIGDATKKVIDIVMKEIVAKH